MGRFPDIVEQPVEEKQVPEFGHTEMASFIVALIDNGSNQKNAPSRGLRFLIETVPGA